MGYIICYYNRYKKYKRYKDYIRNMPKINWKRLLVISYWLLVIGLLVYSRFINLNWGLPYPMHPDERNMANAVQNLNCELPIINYQLPINFSNFKFQISNCFNPHFFAYGQFPLYLAYLGINIFHIFTHKFNVLITFEEAVIALRIISAVASVITAIVIYKLIFNLKFSIFPFDKLRILSLSKGNQFSTKKSQIFKTTILLFIIFSPGLIQFAHFGTTESLLMLFYLLIIRYSILYIQKKILNSYYLILTSIISGMAIATKLSALIFIIIPIMTLLKYFYFCHCERPKGAWQSHLRGLLRLPPWRDTRNDIVTIILLLTKFVSLTLFISVFFSPHNLINFQELIGSMNYESGVATGSVLVFYTRQFVNVVPILFQFFNIFPYVLGWPILILFISGFIFLPRNKEINILRFAFIAYFIPNAFLYAKWSRFMAPILPIILIAACLFLWETYIWVKYFITWKISNIKYQISKINSNNKALNFTLGFALCTLIFALILPGIAYLSIYQNPDVRFQASEWIYKNIPDGSYILSETANVVDIPFSTNNRTMKQSNNYQIISFNFYDLDQEPMLQEELKEHLKKADYIFVPSRRIFANSVCQYPSSEIKSLKQIQFFNFLNYYQNCHDLQKKYPLLNDYYRKLFNGELGFLQVAEFSNPWLNDEQAEETWSVFDHPVIRIFKKVRS
jgi:hypothetical protein